MFFKCRNLTFKYPKSESIVFNDISYTIENPGFHALFGPSGVGKTSFARIIAGEINGFSGEIFKKKTSTFLYSYNQERYPSWASVDHFLKSVTPSSMIEKKKMLDRHIRAK